MVLINGRSNDPSRVYSRRDSPGVLSLANESHIYTRECCANTWYAIGALRCRQGRRDEAEAAFRTKRVTRVFEASIGAPPPC